MNRFRTKKRAKDDLATGRSSEDSEHSGLSFFRKGKKTQQEEVKKEFDLSTALPSTDDFRTSLLMSNLSARFSMLREQDDPNTKIGKASDDSVLYPKRQSRMAEFGFGASSSGLSDIAEVESIRGGTFLRAQSVSSDDPDASTTGGSVMSRSRPTEGNNLFGGRQKIYKIPANSSSGLTGRAVYEDDVALSAFQRWRQAEREKALEGLTGGAVSTEAEDETAKDRSESPFAGYNRKRETTSTTSSSSVAGRNSTAATSITSQPTSTAKDGQSPTVPSSTGVTVAERNVTRTRRLYEQGFNQNSKEPQNSVLSNLARPQPFATKSADSVPTLGLRSLSPPATSRKVEALGSSLKAQTDAKPTLGGLAPLSPPISEGEQVVLPILPQDVGKATALGIFDKPSTPYDESQYVQRQLQLQQGRETPTQRHRAESETKTQLPQPNPPAAQDSRLPPTPATDIATPSSVADNLAALGLSLEVNIERPADEDHPAFRKSALPTPLSIGTKVEDGVKSDYLTVGPKGSPVDSPTLPGPNSGLSGLIRQHLRTESVDSSLGGTAPEAPAFKSHFSGDAQSRPSLGDSGSALSPWPSSDQDWIRSDTNNAAAAPASRDAEFLPKVEASEFKPFDRSSTGTEDEPDEFTSQLTNARRRIREKLTSYVESDSSRAPSPSLAPADSPSAPAPSNTLGILKPKSSRGSLIDRSRNMVPGSSKGLKILGLASSTMSSSPQPSKQTFDDKDFQSLETMQEEVAKEEAAEPSREESNSTPATDASEESAPKKSSDEDSKPIHPGLKAFRQARRELQKRKELEMLARHQGTQSPPPPAQEEVRDPRNMHSAARVDRPRQRTPSGERRPPPVSYRGPVPSEDGYPSPGSTRPSGERSRSGSEASTGPGHSRPPRLRTNTIDEADGQLDPPYLARPVMRSPGLPGKDIKGSPLTPSYPYPYASRGAPSPAPSPGLKQSHSANNLNLQTGRSGLDVFSGQPSPISPMGLPSPSPYSANGTASPAGTPTTLGSRPRGPSTSQSPALGPVRRPGDRRDMSVPSPSQYPPSPGNGQRSRSNSNAPPPPVPPINPRRRRDPTSGGDVDAGAARKPFAGQDFGAGSEDEGGSNRPDQRRKLRKAHPDMQGLMGARETRDNSPPYVARGPPASRVIGGGMGAPEGMI
ncbi:hypothetical protein VTJ49DRAFT_3068 [Mycothermus thermophilus]|uniref:Uncharacterized protein n=1 Tax=Humicola insolens TaxID=85995 RepID=A0ABR3VQ99_HUMIN